MTNGGQQSPPPATTGVTPAQAAAFLADRFGPGVGEVAPIGRGEWSRAYIFRHAGIEQIVRFSAFPDDFARDRLAAPFSSPDLPIPPITETGRAFGGYYAVAPRASGTYLDDLDAASMGATLPALFAALDAARCADLSATTGYGAWDTSGNAPHPTWAAALLDVASDRPTDRTHGWRQRLESSPTGAAPFDETFARLQTLAAACPNERHLIHGDLLNYNVLVAGDRVSAVLDWGCAMTGDLLYDVAWFAFWAPWYPAWHGIDFPAEAARHYAASGLAVPNFAARLRCCQISIGLAAQAYNAFKGRWPKLAATARRTLALATGVADS